MATSSAFHRLTGPVQLGAVLALGLLTGCNSGSGHQGQAPHGGTAAVFDGVGEKETLRFTGTEPFWGGNITGDRMIYSTPDHPDPPAIPVTRFAGNNGLGFTGELEGQQFDMAVSMADCSDGMSDRTYQLSVTLQIGDEMREGCGWTDRLPFRETAAP